MEVGPFETLAHDLYAYPSPLANIDFSAFTQSGWKPIGKYLPKRSATAKEEYTVPGSRGRRGSVMSTRSIHSTRSSRSLKSVKSGKSIQGETSVVLSEISTSGKRRRTSKKSSGKVVKPGKSPSIKSKKSRRKSTTSKVSKVSKASKASKASPDKVK